MIRLPQDEPIGWSELRFGTKCHLGSCQKHEKKAHTKRAQLVLRQTHRQLIKAISTNAAELNIFATARGHAMSSSTGKRRTGSLARHEKPLPLDAASSRSSPFACSSRRLRIECHAVRAQALFKREQRCHFYNYSSFRGLLLRRDTFSQPIEQTIRMRTLIQTSDTFNSSDGAVFTSSSENEVPLGEMQRGQCVFDYVPHCVTAFQK